MKILLFLAFFTSHKHEMNLSIAQNTNLEGRKMVTNVETHIGPSMANNEYRRYSKQLYDLVLSILELE